MCHYITATLPHAVDLSLVTQIFEAHQFGFDLISNPHVAQQIDARERHILTTRKHCDCGTALGSLSHPEHAKVQSYERELKRFRKQGWSETKIKRWLEQKEQTKARHLREDAEIAESTTPELESWLSLLNNLFDSTKAQKFGILLHWYHSSIESERIEIQRKEKLQLSELSAERLMRIEEDVLYEVVP
jgi:hypothetical protein